MTTMENATALTTDFPREKRRIICLLWAEVNLREHGAGKASEVIESWIRRRLPEGSADAYSAAERAACSADGKRPFEPYRPYGSTLPN